VSFATGPCPQCGSETMCDDRDPTPCHDCRNKGGEWVEIRAGVLNPTTGNRQQRRAAKSGRKAKGGGYDTR
jgi:hypothetical protein